MADPYEYEDFSGSGYGRTPTLGAGMTSKYLDAFAGVPMQTFAAPLSNRGNPTSEYWNKIYMTPDMPIRVVDNATGKVVYEGVGYDAAQQASEFASSLLDSGGHKAKLGHPDCCSDRERLRHHRARAAQHQRPRDDCRHWASYRGGVHPRRWAYSRGRVGVRRFFRCAGPQSQRHTFARGSQCGRLCRWRQLVRERRVSAVEQRHPEYFRFGGTKRF